MVAKMAKGAHNRGVRAGINEKNGEGGFTYVLNHATNEG
jgi:hypothetical protein